MHNPRWKLRPPAALMSVTTSGTSVIFSACFVPVIAAATLAVGPLLEGRLSLRAVPVVGWVVWLAVAVPSLLQIPYPQFYVALHRDSAAVLDGGQWWRLATAILVQDGGVPGTISNLILLALALLACLTLWGRGGTVLTFVRLGVFLNLAAVAAGAEDGGGNSGATLPLIASLPPLAFAVLPGSRGRPVAGVVITAAAAATLLVVGDGHGVAVGIGLLLGIAGMPYAQSRGRRGLITAPPRSPTQH